MAQYEDLEIKVHIDDSEASQKLLNMRQKAEKMAQQLNAKNGDVSSISQQMAQAESDIDATKERIKDLEYTIEQFNEMKRNGTSTPEEAEDFMRMAEDIKNVKSELDSENKTLGQQEKEYAKLTEKYEKALLILIKQSQELKQQQELIGKQEAEEIKKGADAMEDLKESTGGAGQSASIAVPNFKKLFKTILKYGLGIRSVYILFRKLKQVVKEAYTALADKDQTTKKNLDGLKSSLGALKGAFGLAFAPIINAVVPWLTKLVDWLTAGANALGKFFAALTGKSSYFKAVKKDMSATSDAASKLKRQLMGFDELNRLDDENDSNDSKLAYDIVEEQLDANDFVTSLGMKFRDIFFDWSDLTTEDILQKIIVGLTALAGGVIGFALGGVGGAIVGTILGAGLGVVFDVLTFDGDGTVNSEELKKVICAGVATVLGAGVGFIFGGPAGAMLGAAIGLTLSISLSFLKKKSDKENKYGTTSGWFICGVLGLPTDAEWVEYFKQLKKWVWDGGILAVWNELTTIGEQAYDFGSGIVDKIGEGLSTFGDKVKTWWDESVKPWFTAEKWKQLGQDAINGIKAGFSAIKLPTIDVETISYSFWGRTINVPRLRFNFNAKGGIVDAATLFGGGNIIGEAGKEAIIPLERNTEWIGLVVDGVLNALTESNRLNQLANAFATLPNMANGSIIPPNSTAASALSEIGEALSRLASINAESSGESTENINLQIDLDGLTLARKLYQYNRKVNTEHGRTLVTA